MSRRARTRASLVLALAVMLALTGCGGRPDLEASRAHALQMSVLTVTQDAADGRWADARSALEVARGQLQAGSDANEVSLARYRAINAALDEVGGELDAEEAAAAAAAAARVAAQPEVSAAPSTPATTQAPSGPTQPAGKAKGKGAGQGNGKKKP